MLFIVVSVTVLLFSAALALMFSRDPLKASAAGAAGAVSASLIGLIPAVKTLLLPAKESFSIPCSLPIGSFNFVLDPLAAVFLVPVFVLTAAAALYSLDYLKPFSGKKPLGLAWAMFNILSASMVLVLVSADAIPFLIGWEAMAAASFALVVFEHDKPQVRRAGPACPPTHQAGCVQDIEGVIGPATHPVHGILEAHEIGEGRETGEGDEGSKAFREA